MAGELQKYDVYQPRIITDREREEVREVLRSFSQYQLWRNTHAQQWEEAAELILPTSRNTFFYGNFNWPGQKKTDRQIDASGMLALHRFCAIADSIVTPRNIFWHAIRAGGPDSDYIMKDQATKLWFEETNKTLFKLRYADVGNFSAQNYNNYQSLGAFGNSTMYVDAFDARQWGGELGLRYRAVPLGETFFGVNHQGKVDRMIRWFKLTAYQAVQKWGYAMLPANLHPALEQDSQWPYNFLHCVKPRDDFDPDDRISPKGKPWSSKYVSIEGQCLMAKEGGFRVFPYAVSRYDQTPMEWYGRGPAQIVLPSLKTLNAQKRTFLKQGHRAADPVLLTADDGLIDFQLRPGSLNKGAMTMDGKRLVDVLPTGDIQISEKMMAEERSIIDDVFLVSLFKPLVENPNMTATQVIELVNERGMLVAPTLGRQHAEYVGGLVPREMDLASAIGALRPMPPRLREAGGRFEVVDTSPLALAARAGQAAGVIRSLETTKELANITQDMSVFDPYNLDAITAFINETQMTPPSLMATDQQIAQKRKARAKAQAEQAQIQAMPAQAQMLKAQHAVQKDQPGVAPGQQGLGGPVPQGAPQ